MLFHFKGFKRLFATFKFVNCWIRGFVFLCHEQVIFVVLLYVLCLINRCLFQIYLFNKKMRRSDAYRIPMSISICNDKSFVFLLLIMNWTWSKLQMSAINLNMDFVRSYFGTNEPLTGWTLFSSLFDWFAVFNWSEVHLFRSNFLQNPYFKRIQWKVVWNSFQLH